MSNAKKRALWSRFPEMIREMRKAVFLKHGIPEEKYPIAMRRILYLAYSQRLKASPSDASHRK